MRRLAIVAVLTASSLLFAQPAFGQCNFMPFDLAVRQADAVWLGTVTDATVSAVGSGLTLTVSLDDVLKGHQTSDQTVTAFPPACNGPRIDWNKAAQEAIGKQQLFVGHYTDGSLAIQPINFLPPLDNPTLLELYQRALKDLGLPPADVQGGPPAGIAAWVWWVAAAVATVALIAGATIVLVWRRRMKRAAYTYAVAIAFAVVGIVLAVLIPTTRTVGPFSKPPSNPRVVDNPIAPVYFNHHVALRIAVALLGVALGIAVMAVGRVQRQRSHSNRPSPSET
jgi:hypothetical protein